MKQQDIKIIIPAEYVNALLEVIKIGLQRAKIDPIERRELMAWWEAEQEFIGEDLTNNK